MRVAVVTPVLAHYRKNLFLQLDRKKAFRFTHYSEAQAVPTESSLRINAFDPRELRDFKPVRNLTIGSALWQIGVLRMAVSRRYDACIFTGSAAYLSTWLAGILARLTGKKVYFWTIGWHRPETGIKRRVRLAFYKIAHRLMVYGDPEKARAIAHGYPEARIDVVYNSVTDLNEVDPRWCSYDSKEQAVGAVVRLNPVKNLQLLLEAVAILNGQGRDLKVVLAGAGPQRATLEARANQLGVSCEFLGAVYASSEIAAFYRRIMVTVIPTTAGLTTIQSLAHGVPVITDDDEYTQAPEASAILTGCTGARFKAGDVQSLSIEISKWLDLLTENGPEISRYCRDEVRTRWSPEVQAQKIVESLSKNHGGRSHVTKL